jgi:hypothetical protein
MAGIFAGAEVFVMKTTHGRKILQRKRQSQSQVKSDLMRGKSRKETKRESGERFYHLSWHLLAQGLKKYQILIDQIIQCLRRNKLF